MPDVAWEEASCNVYDNFFYSLFCSGSGSGGVAREINRPGKLVSVAVNLFSHLRDLYVVVSLGDDEQDVCHAIDFIDGVKHVS